MKVKYLHLALILTPLTGYLQWGKDQHAFLYQVEGDLLSRIFSDPASVMHPLVLLPLAGQLLLLVTLFQKRVSRGLSLAGLACSAILPGFVLLVGLLGMNGKMILSVMPFMLTAAGAILYNKKYRVSVAGQGGQVLMHKIKKGVWRKPWKS